MKILCFFSLNVCSSGFLTVILLLREDVIILDCTALCRFLLQYLCTHYMKYSVFQCCNFSVQFSPHAIPGKRNVVDFIPTNAVVFLTFLVVEVHMVDLIFQWLLCVLSCLVWEVQTEPVHLPISTLQLKV